MQPVSLKSTQELLPKPLPDAILHISARSNSHSTVDKIVNYLTRGRIYQALSTFEFLARGSFASKFRKR